MPVDQQLPGASLLFDLPRMRKYVQTSFARPGQLSQLQVRYFEYVPGQSLRVQYRAEIGTYRYDLSAQLGFPEPDRQTLTLCSKLPKERSLARLPITKIFAEGNPCITWFPVDLGLPMLLRTDVEMADLLGMDSAGPTTRLGWKPGQRAALRFPEAFVKVYRDPAKALAASNALKVVGAHVPTAHHLHRNAEEGLVAQQLLNGSSILRNQSLDTVDEAAGFLAGLHDVAVQTADPNRTTPVHDPSAMLSALGEPIKMVQLVLPHLSDRLDTLVGNLEKDAPTPGATVLSHGDFHVGQFFRTHAGPKGQPKSELYVVDFDKLCLAGPALDVANYASTLMTGQPSDYDEMMTVSNRFCEVYPTKIDALPWYLAAGITRRIDRPVRRLEGDWSAQTETMLASAERCLVALR